MAIKKMTVEMFDGTTALTKIETLSTRAEVKTVLKLAQTRGFTPAGKVADVQGFKRTYTSDKVIAEGGEQVTKLDYSFFAQNLVKAGSTDIAAMVVTTLNAPGVTKKPEIDVRFLVAPGGDVTKTVEMRYDAVTKGVISTNSWWTRLKACIKGSCSSVCAAALGTCTLASWAGYLQCLAIACGGCSAKCVACATCKCRWWCKWATGCCKD